jgi:hypothetical protein
VRFGIVYIEECRKIKIYVYVIYRLSQKKKDQIRNLNTKEALVNGTRMRIKFMHRNAIDCEVLTGTARNKRILIPRINLTYSYFSI